MTVKRILLLGFALHLIAAVFSIGWNNPDEYFQTLQFTALKLDLLPAVDMTYEYDNQVRSWVLPALYLGVFKVTKLVGLVNPFDGYLWSRVLMALIGFASTWALTVSLIRTRLGGNWVERQPLWLFLWMMLFPLLPVVHARTSAESLAGSLLSIATAFLLMSAPNLNTRGISHGRSIVYFAIAGMAFGFAVETRLQCLPFVFGMFCWALWKIRLPLGHWIVGVSSFCLAIGICTAIDSWGYGAPVFTPWNYFMLNAIYAKASEFGTMPIWGYLKLLIASDESVWGAVYCVAFAVFLYRYPSNPLIFGVVPFFIAHSLVPHKELRFLYPLVNFAAVLLFDPVISWIQSINLRRRRSALVFLALVFMYYHALNSFRYRRFHTTILEAISRHGNGHNLIFGTPATSIYGEGDYYLHLFNEGYRYEVSSSQLLGERINMLSRGEAFFFYFEGVAEQEAEFLRYTGPCELLVSTAAKAMKKLYKCRAAS